MNTPNITFVIFTYNEEKRIERVIKNFIGYGDILLADDNSTDRTREIAASYGCTCIIRESCPGFTETQIILDQVTANVKTDWIYWGYADEMMSKKALEEIQKIIIKDKYDIINIMRKNYFYGKFCYDAFSTRANRIFKKNSLDFRNNIMHCFGVPLVDRHRIFNLPNNFFIHHFISNNTMAQIATINKYTDVDVDFYGHIKNFVVFVLIYPVLIIVNNYIRKGGYRAGIAGFHLTILYVFYYIVRNMKIYERNALLSRERIENLNDQHRDTIINQL